KKAGLTTKSGLMMGLGERDEEVLEVMKDWRKAGVDLITLGQYMQPTENHLSVKRYVELATFAYLQEQGMAMGFTNVFAGPLVRSSYHADEQASMALV
ncbi:lipoyl synthase, partial [bacterium]|nr:lipoyl synthase [bacterium]